MRTVVSNSGLVKKLARRYRPASSYPGSHQRRSAGGFIGKARHNRVAPIVVRSDLLPAVQNPRRLPRTQAIGHTEHRHIGVVGEVEPQRPQHPERPGIVKRSDDHRRSIAQVHQCGRVLSAPSIALSSSLQHAADLDDWAQVVDHRLEGVEGGQRLYRLATSILDPAPAQAKELAALYHQRWEIETAFDELKTRLRGAQIVLRSKTPELVRQEFYGLLMTHFAICGLMHEAALQAKEDPDRPSFLHAVRVVRKK